MSHEHAAHPTLKTNLRSFPQVEIDSRGEFSGPSKKAARKDVSLLHTSECLGFLHSVLIEIQGNSYLLAGPSGIGKSTYSGRLTEELGGKVLAHDWVGVEKVGENFYASDLNFPENMVTEERSLLSGVIFLTGSDELKRDAYSPNPEEFNRLLKETFDTSTEHELEKLSEFWNTNISTLPFLCAVPARRGDEDRIKNTLVNLLAREEQLKKPLEVGVVGLGSIGTELAFQLAQLPYISKVHLFSRSNNKTIGYALDMNQALSKGREDIFVAHKTPGDVFLNSSNVFFTFRDEVGQDGMVNMPERWQKLPRHLEILDEYISVLTENSFDGTVFMVTNPVDVLTYSLYQKSQNSENPLKTYQVYGAGLELDVNRAMYYGRKINSQLKYSDINIFGNHSDKLVIKTPMSPEENKTLSTSVNSASKEIRQSVPRTIYGPVGATVKTFDSYIKGGIAHATLLMEDSHIGRRVKFQNHLPQMAEYLMDEEYKNFVENNKLLFNTHIKLPETI